MKKFLLFVSVFLLVAVNANATLISLGADSFTPVAEKITFDEVPLYTKNPVYDFSDAENGDYSVSFGAYFEGGVGTPTVGDELALDFSVAEKYTFTCNDGAPGAESPVLSGSPQFAGSVAVLFSQDVAAVGLVGGYFDAIGATTIVAFDRQGNELGSVTNTQLGFEFFGLGDSTGDAVIAGIQFYITGNEPAGYAIDNLTFAFGADGYDVDPVPEPATMFLLGSGLLGMLGFRKKKK